MQQALFKDGVQNAVGNICLNLHVQVGTLSRVFDHRPKRYISHMVQIRFPEGKSRLDINICQRTPQTFPSSPV